MNEYKKSSKEPKEELREGRDYIIKDGLRIDAKEFDPRYKDIIKRVEEEAEEGVVRKDLFWFDIWHNEKEILKKKYGMDWRSIAELNPEITFD